MSARITKDWLRARFDGINIGDDSDVGYFTVGQLAAAMQARVREFCKGTGFKLKRIAKWQLAEDIVWARPHAHVYIWLLAHDGECARIELYLRPRKAVQS